MDKIKSYFLKNFEQTFVFVLLVSVALINNFVPYKLAFLNFYFIPVLLTAYYLDVRRALLGAVLCLIMVSFFFYRDPASFYPGNTNLDIAMNILTWACFLILSGAIVGNLSLKLQQEVRQSQTLHRPRACSTSPSTSSASAPSTT
jgi:adenylate cyclase